MTAKRNSRRKVDRAQPARARGVVSVWPAVGRITGAVCLSMAIAALGWFGYQQALSSNFFELKDVTVSGNIRCTKEELLRLGQIKERINLLSLDVEALERQLSRHPWVHSLAIERRLPSTLRIEVVEHQAVASLSVGDLYLVSSDGVPFKRAQAAEALNLPLITGLDREGWAKSSERSRVLASVKQALQAIQSYSHESQAAAHPLSEVHVSSVGLTLVMQDGEEVCIAEGDYPQQWKNLSQVRAELKRRNMVAEVIRLDNRSRRNWVTVQAKQVEPNELAVSR